MSSIFFDKDSAQKLLSVYEAGAVIFYEAKPAL